LKLYRRTILESDLKAAELEKQSLHDKSKREGGIVRVGRESVCARAQRGRRDEGRRDEGTCATATLAYP
jgi:hypothetical protein